MCRKTIWMGLALAWSAAASTQTAVVLQVRGTWYVEPARKRLLPGTEVPSGSVVSPDAESGVGSIVIALPDETTLTAACSQRPCASGITVPKLAPRADLKYQSILAAVKAVLLNESGAEGATFESGSARGITLLRREALIRYEPGKPVALASFLGDVPPGRYHATVRRTGDAQFLRSLSIECCAPDPPQTFEFPSPGVYSWDLTDAFGSPAANIVIGVLDSGSLASAEPGFVHAQAISSQWSGREASAAAHTFVRAYLISVIEQHGP